METSFKRREEIVALFVQAAWEISGKQLSNLPAKAKISQLGIDSVGLMEVIGYLEEHTSVRFPDDRLAGVQTVEDLTNLIIELQQPQSLAR